MLGLVIEKKVRLELIKERAFVEASHEHHQCLNDFVAFLRVHFDTEEDVLLRGHCPSDIYQRHIAEHSKYLEALTEILVEGVWQELDGERLIELMVGWVLHHLTAFDLPSKAFMADCV